MAAVAGSFPVGFFTVVPDNRAPQDNTISNDLGADTLMIENRWAGPLSVRPVDRDTQVPLYAFGFHLPPLQRVQLPWDASWDALVQSMLVSSFSNWNFLNVVAPGPVSPFQAAQVRWLLSDSGGGFAQAPLYPPDSQTFILAQRRAPVTQGGNHVLWYLGTNNVPPGTWLVATPIFLGATGFPPRPPSSPGNDVRLMRLGVNLNGGTAQMSDLRVNVHHYCGTDSVDPNPTGIIPFTGAGAIAGANIAPATAMLDIPGAMAVEIDADLGAAGVTANITATFYLGVPNF